jgi:hypothetical protein
LTTFDHCTCDNDNDLRKRLDVCVLDVGRHDQQPGVHIYTGGPDGVLTEVSYDRVNSADGAGSLDTFGNFYPDKSNNGTA